MIKYIFCINPGRSGSKYLAELFSFVTDCRSFHEPDPVMSGKFIRDYNNDTNHSYLFKRMEKKVHAVKECSKGSGLYVETNHTFIKGFGWKLSEYIDPGEIGVIILKRSRDKVRESLYNLRCTPLTKIGRHWLFLPDDKKRRAQLPYPYFISVYRSLSLLKSFYLKTENFGIKEPVFLRDFELECLDWYLDEVEARTELYKLRWPQVKYLEVNLKDLNDPGTVGKILKGFSIDHKIRPEINEVLNHHSNRKTYVHN